MFKEVPPGTRATATMTALATTIFIWVAGYLISHRETIANSDLPLLLLALPTIGASYFGFAADGGSLVGSSLLARISLTVSGFVSIGAIITYLLQIPAVAHLSSAQIHRIAARHHFAFFVGLTQPAWVILFIISAVNFIYIAWRFLKKLRYYAKLTNKTNLSQRGYSSR